MRKRVFPKSAELILAEHRLMPDPCDSECEPGRGPSRLAQARPPATAGTRGGLRARKGVTPTAKGAARMASTASTFTVIDEGQGRGIGRPVCRPSEIGGSRFRDLHELRGLRSTINHELWIWTIRRWPSGTRCGYTSGNSNSMSAGCPGARGSGFEVLRYFARKGRRAPGAGIRRAFSVGGRARSAGAAGLG